MKKGILTAFLAFVLLITTQFSAFAAGEETQVYSSALSPSLVSAGYSVSKKTVSPKDTFTLNFTLKNTSSNIDIENVNIRLSGGEAFAVNNDTDTIYASKIAKNGKKSFSKSFYCIEGAAAGVYPISLSATFEYFENSEKFSSTSEINYSVRVSSSGNVSLAPLTPQLIVSDFNYGGESINASQTFDLSFSLKNTSKTTAVKNVIVKLSGAESFTVAEGTDTIPVDTIKAGSSVKLSKKFASIGSVTSGVYPVIASVSYEYYENGEKQAGTAELSMSIPVVQPDKVEIGTLDLSDSTVTENQETDCGFTIINSGRTNATNLSVKLVDEKGKELAKAYVGNILAGEQFVSNYTLPVTFKEAGTYNLEFVVEYDNESMEKKTVSQKFTVTAEKKVDPYEEAMNAQNVPAEDTDDYQPTAFYGIIAAVVVVAVVIVAVVIKKKKSKKGSDELDEEI